MPVLMPDLRRCCRCSPACRVILRQLPGLDPVSGLLVVLVAVVAALALFAALLLALLPAVVGVVLLLVAARADRWPGLGQISFVTL